MIKMTKLKLILLFSVVLTVNLLFSQNNSEFILWGAKQIEWSDFKGNPDKTSKGDALTNSGIRLPFFTRNDTLIIIIQAEFYPNISWKNTNVTERLLKHEQIHFDITEYHARKFREEFSKHNFTSFESVKSELTDMNNRHFMNFSEMQNQYDLETNHSIIDEEQTRWNKKVALLLKQTAIYSDVTWAKYIGGIR